LLDPGKRYEPDITGELASPFLTEERFLPQSDAGWKRPSLAVADDSVFEQPMALAAELTRTEALERDFVSAETGVIGAENRVRVKNTTDVPWRWICKIRIEDSRGREISMGTGVLVSDRHVLTAAHVVYAAHQNMHLHTVTVIPALNDLDEPFGSYSIASNPKIRQEYRPAADPQDWDYALLTLRDAIGAKSFSALKGGILCYWGSPQCGSNTVFARPDPRTLNGKAVYTAGYPGGKGGKQLWCGAGILHSANERRRTMWITADATRGQSGSPVWVIDNKRYCLVGVAAGASANSNRVVRVTRELIKQLRAWVSEDGDSPSMTESKELFEAAEIEFDEPEESAPEAEDEEASAARWARLIEGYTSDDEAVGAELDEEVVFRQEEWDEEESGLFEAFAPKVSQSVLRVRIDQYLDLAKFEYKMHDKTKVKAWPQFHYARAQLGETKMDRDERIRKAILKVSGVLGSAFEKKHPRAIHNAAWGRPKPGEIAAVTQGLITAKKLNLADEHKIRRLQQDYEIGIDCAGYVQLAFIFAFMKSDKDTEKVRLNLGLHERRGYEKLASLPSSHFNKIPITDARTGDLFVLEPKATSSDQAWHTVIIVDRTVSETVHTFLVDASWGTDLYTDAAGGVARRTLMHDASSGKWWDIHPINGTKEHENSTGPYDGHPIHGMYRAKHKK
jgi:V8-like Glu-specific endopeptidase